jgi:hypothetical protein
MQFERENKFMRYKAGTGLFGRRRHANILEFNNDPIKNKTD